MRYFAKRGRVGGWMSERANEELGAVAATHDLHPLEIVVVIMATLSGVEIEPDVNCPP